MFDVIVVDFRLGYYCIRYRVLYMPCYMVICEKGHSSRVTTRAGARRAARAARRGARPDTKHGTDRRCSAKRSVDRLALEPSAHGQRALAGRAHQTHSCEDALRLAHYGCP